MLKVSAVDCRVLQTLPWNGTRFGGESVRTLSPPNLGIYHGNSQRADCANYNTRVSWGILDWLVTKCRAIK